MNKLAKNQFQVVIVDDEPEICEILAEFLIMNRYKVNSFVSAKEALEFMKKNTVHLIISDDRMPIMTGVEFLTEVRVEFGRHIPFIMVTGQSDLSKEEAILWGATELLAKPVNFFELIGLVNREFEALQERWFTRHRIPAQFKIEGTVRDVHFAGDVTNISNGGIFIAYPTVTFFAGDEVFFKIKVLNNKSEIEGRGFVKWIRSGSLISPPGIGLQFTNINEHELETLLKIADSQVA